MRNSLTFCLNCTLFWGHSVLDVVIWPNCDRIVRKLATVSCHLYDGNALQGQQGNFLHRHSLYGAMKGKCVSLRMHLRAGLKKSAVYRHLCHSSFTFSHTHTHICTHVRVISSALSGEGRAGSTVASRWSVYSIWVMGQAGMDFPVLLLRCRGDEDEDGLDKGMGGISGMREGHTSSAVSYIFKRSPPTPAQLNTPQKPNYRYREVLKRQVTWRQGLRG